MIELHKIVDEIRLFLQAADRTDSPRLRELAKIYATTCSEANERISRCLFFLRQGLRGEAIHLADTAPTILELLSILDFSERTEWEELAFEYDWPRAPALALESAQALNEAYAAEELIKDLMQTHRLRALSRAPLAQRLETLRKIAKIDTANSIWNDDIRIFEKARLAEFDDELKRAVAGADLAAITAIQAEFSSPDWLDPPSAARVAAAKNAFETIRRAHARTSLAAVTTSLVEAHSAGNLSAAMPARERWNALAKEAALSRSDALWDRAQPALAWLAAADGAATLEEEYQAAVADVIDALAQGAPRSELERLEKAVWDLNRDLPSNVDRDVQKRYRQLESKTRMVVIGGFAGFTALALAVVWGFMAYRAADQRAEAIETAIRKIDTDVGTNNFVQARKAYDALLARYPDLAESQRLIEPNSRIQLAERKEADRVKQFELELEGARREITGNPNESPQVSRLKELAKLPEEKAAVASLINEKMNKESSSKAQTDVQLLKSLKSLELQLAASELDVRLKPLANETGNAITALKADVDKLKAVVEHAGDDVKEKTNSFIKRFERAEKTRADRVDQDLLEKAIVATVRLNMDPKHIDEYVERCRDFQKRFPDSPRSKDFEIALARAEIWKAAVDWHRIISGWKGGLDSLLPRDITSRIDAITEHRDTFKPFPDESVVADTLTMLQAAKAANDDGGDGPSRELFKLFDHRLMSDLWWITVGNGSKTYYSTVKPTRNSAGVLIEALTDVPVEGNKFSVAKTLVKEDGPSEPTLSAQSNVAKRVKGLLASMAATPESWDRTMSEIILAMRSDNTIDPVLQLPLLARTMELASKGSYGLGKAVAPTIALILDPKNDIDFDAHWFNPDDAAAANVRRKAKAVRDTLPLLTNLKADAKANRDELNSRIHRPRRPVGCLLQDDSGKWRCHGPKGLARAESLWVLSADNAWSKVGHTTELGEYIIEDGAAEKTALVQGQVVFSMAASK